MRTHMAKSLQSRSKAIQNAIKSYNAAAVAVDRPTVDWQQITHYSFLEDFTLLRDTRPEVLTKKWAVPVYRLAMRQHRRIKRAREEVTRCFVETRRLHTAIVDEEQDVMEALRSLRRASSPVYGALEEWWRRRRRINARLLAGIQRVYGLAEYTGERGPGVRVGRTTTRSVGQLDATVVDEGNEEEAGDVEHDDEMRRGLDNVMEFFGRLDLS